MTLKVYKGQCDNRYLTVHEYNKIYSFRVCSLTLLLINNFHVIRKYMIHGDSPSYINFWLLFVRVWPGVGTAEAIFRHDNFHIFNNLHRFTPVN